MCQPILPSYKRHTSQHKYLCLATQLTTSVKTQLHTQRRSWCKVLVTRTFLSCMSRHNPTLITVVFLESLELRRIKAHHIADRRETPRSTPGESRMRRVLRAIDSPTSHSVVLLVHATLFLSPRRLLSPPHPPTLLLLLLLCQSAPCHPLRDRNLHKSVLFCVSSV